MKEVLDCQIGKVERGRTINIARGEHMLLTAYVLDEDKAVYSLSDCTVRMRIMLENSPVTTITLTSTMQQALLGIAAAEIDLNRSIEPGTYWYDVWLTDPDGNQSRIYPACAFVVLPSSNP